MMEETRNPLNTFVKERHFQEVWQKMKKNAKRKNNNLGSSKRNAQVRSWRFTSFLFSGRDYIKINIPLCGNECDCVCQIFKANPMVLVLLTRFHLGTPWVKTKLSVVP